MNIPTDRIHRKPSWNYSAVLLVAYCVFTPTDLSNAQAVERPMILVKHSERQEILERIATKNWAKEIYNDFIASIEKEADRHQADPDRFLRNLPFDWKKKQPGEIPPFHLTCHIENGVGQNLDNVTDQEWIHGERLTRYLQIGVDCGIAYFLTQDEKYARCATDILYSFVKGVSQSELSEGRDRGGWLFPDDGFREVREIGYKVPLIYDFVAEYVKNGGAAYDIAQKATVSFPVSEAQQVFRTYADLTISYGHTGSNHSILEAPNLVYNAVAMEDEAERSKLLSCFLTDNTENQDALNVMANFYREEGDIWPETSQYLNSAASILTRLMVTVNKYDPSLHLGRKYTNILYALPILDFLVYPNGEIIRWGDGKRYGSPPYRSYEDAYVLAKMDGLERVTCKFGPLIKRAYEEGKYRRSGMQAVFWYDDPIDGDSESTTLPRTDRVFHAGIFLQRNLSPTKRPEDGLMCFVGGAPMVHGHAEGMNIELFGEGQVLGVDNGRGSYQQEIHENYSRIFAAHNTVIVNGSSQGASGWANLGINTVQKISMEPDMGQDAVSPYYSFTQTSFVDDRGDKAECAAATHARLGPHLAENRILH